MVSSSTVVLRLPHHGVGLPAAHTEKVRRQHARLLRDDDYDDPRASSSRGRANLTPLHAWKASDPSVCLLNDRVFVLVFAPHDRDHGSTPLRAFSTLGILEFFGFGLQTFRPHFRRRLEMAARRFESGWLSGRGASGSARQRESVAGGGGQSKRDIGGRRGLSAQVPLALRTRGRRSSLRSRVERRGLRTPRGEGRCPGRG